MEEESKGEDHNYYQAIALDIVSFLKKHERLLFVQFNDRKGAYYLPSSLQGKLPEPGP